MNAVSLAPFFFRPIRACRIIAALLLVWTASTRADRALIFSDPSDAGASFAVGDIQSALQFHGHEVRLRDLSALPEQPRDPVIVLSTASDSQGLARVLAQANAEFASRALKPEGYALRSSQQDGVQVLAIVGADGAGVLYGGLDAAEQIRSRGLHGVREGVHQPYMSLRGTKFNIPLDVRTPSYTDVCDAAQYNIAEMWSLDFWKGYLDALARCRFNFVSLWNLHPFPSMTRVPEYPEIALNDVLRSTVDWEEHYTLQARDFDRPEILGNVETVRRMTIDDKMAFWRKVMRYGKERNIDFYVITWNIFVYGVDGKYGVTDDINNPVTVDYFRKSVHEMFRTYPDLKGIGLTTGENMPGSDFREKETWAFNAYAQGTLDAAREMPGRKIVFVHRQHQTGANEIAEMFQPLIEHPDIEFIFSFKYAKAHALSSTTQPFHREFVRDIGELKTIWTLRNDDNYHFRWGAPDFVREFIQNIPYGVSRGFYYGSDQYVWGREFLSLRPRTPRQLEVEKHWFHWMLWGRLGYDPELSNEDFAELLAVRFPEASGEILLEAWQAASMIYPLVTGFHWGVLDFQWYIEACLSRPGPARTPSGFHDVNRFISLPPHPGTDCLSIPKYVEALAGGREPSGTTPIQVSEKLHETADRALSILEGLPSVKNDELKATLEDIRAMAYLGKYYACKIRGATELALFRKTGGLRRQERSVHELKKAASHWRAYVEVAARNYRNPLWTNRVGHVDWRELTEWVDYDVIIAGGSAD